MALPSAVTKFSQFEAEGEIGGNVMKGGGLLRKETFGAGRLLDLLSIARIEYSETVPVKVGATIEETPAVGLGHECRVLAIGSTIIPKYNIDFKEMIRSVEVRESETKTARVMEADVEITKVKTVLSTILMGLQFARPYSERKLWLLASHQQLSHYQEEQ